MFNTIEPTPELDQIDRLLLHLEQLEVPNRQDEDAMQAYRKKLKLAEQKLGEKLGETATKKFDYTLAETYTIEYLNHILEGAPKPKRNLQVQGIERKKQAKKVIAKILEDFSTKFREDSALIKSIIKRLKQSETIEELRGALAVYEAAIEVEDEVEYWKGLATHLANEVDEYEKYKTKTEQYTEEIDRLYNLSFSEDEELAKYQRILELRKNGYKEKEIHEIMQVTRQELRTLDRKYEEKVVDVVVDF